MPRAPKLCARCNRVAVGGSYCDTCRPEPFAGAKDRWKARRPGNWESVRKAAIRRAGGRCQVEGCTARGTDVDKIKPSAEGGAWTLDNVRLVCRTHHLPKIQEEARRGRERRRKMRTR